MEAFVGTIMAWPLNWAPAGWLLCDGSVLPVNNFQALFSLIGTTYGGNGTTNFALPDLRGRVPVGFGQAPGLSNYALGQKGGNESTTLTAAQLPPLAVNVAIPAVANSNGDAAKPSPSTSLCKIQGASLYSDQVPDTTLKPFTATTTGTNNLPVENRQPFLGINFIICNEGIYPTRP